MRSGLRPSAPKTRLKTKLVFGSAKTACIAKVYARPGTEASAVVDTGVPGAARVVSCFATLGSTQVAEIATPKLGTVAAKRCAWPNHDASSPERGT